ncbi:MAG: hypothetical protein Q7V62_04895 [Actinomycetota bacterium]|nr:hypothetical protein [Actinomycetota bacterium]
MDDWLAREGTERLRWAADTRGSEYTTLPLIDAAPRKAVDAGLTPLIVPMEGNLFSATMFTAPAHVQARTRAWDVFTEGTPAQFKRFRALVDQTRTTWLGRTSWDAAEERSMFRSRPSPGRTHSALEAMLLQCLWDGGAYGKPIQAMLFATMMVYGVRAARVALAWILFMSRHRVFNGRPDNSIGGRDTVERMYRILQALAEQRDTGNESVEKAKAVLVAGSASTWGAIVVRDDFEFLETMLASDAKMQE